MKEFKKNLDGIIEAWYPGQQGGNALADLLVGASNPSGKLPITFYKSEKDLPDFEDYTMKGRTYKYFAGTPLYPFGYGLSYSNFEYSNLQLSKKMASASDSVTAMVTVKNTSALDGTDVVELYASAKNIAGFRPIKTLIGFTKTSIKAGETKEVTIKFAVESLRQFDEAKDDYTIYPGEYNIGVGASSSDIKRTSSLNIK